MNRTRRAFLWTLAGAAPAAYWLSTWFRNRAALDYQGLATLDPEQMFDVCIAGSGPAGAILACNLASRGVKVLIVESGVGSEVDLADPPEFVRFERRSDGIPAGFTYPINATRYIGPGGTSNLWGGFCPRFDPSDFSASLGSAPNLWPIRYPDLAPYYAQAEKELFVEAEMSEGGAALIDRLARNGFPCEMRPMSRWRTAPVNVEESHLSLFRRAASATMVTDARVTRILPSADGHVASLDVRSAAGVTRHVRARHYVLAVGGIETPRLLLVSTSRQFPQGIGNQHDHVGRYFSEHLQTAADGWRSAKEPGSDGPVAEVYSRQFYEEFKAAGAGGMILEVKSDSSGLYKLALAPMMEMTSSPANRVYLDPVRTDRFGNPRAAIALSLSSDDLRTLDRSDAVTQTIFSGMGLSSSVWTGSTTMLHHHMGTCRMASDPAEGVVDADLRVHGTENLYVAGSAAFSTTSAVPPTLTIVALSLRLADHLAERLAHQSR